MKDKVYEDESTLGIVQWARKIGDLSADALVDAGVVDRAGEELARDVIVEEVFVRLVMGDHPPPFEPFPERKKDSSS